MKRLGIIARMDKTGLGYQTLNLVRMLNPQKVIVIDSSSFNNNEQFPDWYKNYNGVVIKGFPGGRQVVEMCKGLDAILTCETAYNNNLYSYGIARRVNIYCQPNYEFGDHLISRIAQPAKWLMPSNWYLKEWSERFGNTYLLPPPTFPEDFEVCKSANLKRKGKRKFLHIVGRAAERDRNGTKDILEAMKKSKADFELVLSSQKPLDINTADLNDPRIKVVINDFDEQNALYEGYDAVIMPRRYGGLCLPMNEALLSALPVIMTDVSPNNALLPKQWLVEARKTDEFMARVMIDVYSSNIEMLAAKLDEFATMSDSEILKQKKIAYKIGIDNFSPSVLKQKYIDVMELDK